MPFGLWTPVGPRMGTGESKSPMRMGNFEGAKVRLIVKYRDALPLVVQKRLNRSRCRKECGLGWTQESMCWCWYAPPGEYDLTRPCDCAAAIRPCVKLLWPLVTSIDSVENNIYSRFEYQVRTSPATQMHLHPTLVSTRMHVTQDLRRF